MNNPERQVLKIGSKGPVLFIAGTPEWRVTQGRCSSSLMVRTLMVHTNQHAHAHSNSQHDCCLGRSTGH
eukprot:1668090-Amphidinium_carterae.1